MPFLFFCAAFGGHALAAGWRTWRSRPRNPWVLGIAALCAIAMAVGVLTTRSTPRDRLRIASVLSMQERLDDSLDLLRPLVSGEAPDPYALDQAGWVLQKKGDLEAARDHYVRALEGELAANRACQTGTRLAIVHERLGEIELAAARHDLTVANASANTWNYYERAMFRSRRGDREGAIEDLRESVRLAPAWSPPRTALRELGVTD
jgi:tetratricopeptide (TPR) repeat protein